MHAPLCIWHISKHINVIIGESQENNGEIDDGFPDLSKVASQAKHEGFEVFGHKNLVEIRHMADIIQD